MRLIELLIILGEDEMKNLKTLLNYTRKSKEKTNATKCKTEYLNYSTTLTMKHVMKIFNL